MSKNSRKLSVYQLSFSSIGLLIVWGIAFYLLRFIVFRRGEATLFEEGSLPLLLGIELGYLGLLLIPSIGLSLACIFGSLSPEKSVNWQKLSPIIWLFPFIWIAGGTISDTTPYYWTFLRHPLAVVSLTRRSGSKSCIQATHLGSL